VTGDRCSVPSEARVDSNRVPRDVEAQRAIEASATVLRRANDAFDGVLDALRS
jgi:hypothetical protein